MPHYKDGTRAELGDIVKGRVDYIPHEIQGVVGNIFESDTCNAAVHYLSKTVLAKATPDGIGETKVVLVMPAVATMTLKECEKVA